MIYLCVIHHWFQYAQRSVIKSLQYIKHRTYSRNPIELVEAIHHNPLKVKVTVEPSRSLSAKILRAYKTPISNSLVREPFVMHISTLYTYANGVPDF